MLKGPASSRLSDRDYAKRVFGSSQQAQHHCRFIHKDYVCILVRKTRDFVLENQIFGVNAKSSLICPLQAYFVFCSNMEFSFLINKQI